MYAAEAWWSWRSGVGNMFILGPSWFHLAFTFVSAFVLPIPCAYPVQYIFWLISSTGAGHSAAHDTKDSY